MEEAFHDLEKQHENTVDNLVMWLKDSHIVDGENVSEDTARQLFADVEDTQNVGLEKFKEAVSKLASDQKKPFEEFTDLLAAEAPKLLNALISAAVNTLKTAIVTSIVKAISSTSKGTPTKEEDNKLSDEVNADEEHEGHEEREEHEEHGEHEEHEEHEEHKEHEEHEEHESDKEHEAEKEEERKGDAHKK